jgi:antitoxin (DNA-binding transcriptional repressor) of toxin-antitoxin stability system
MRCRSRGLLDATRCRGGGQAEARQCSSPGRLLRGFGASARELPLRVGATEAGASSISAAEDASSSDAAGADDSTGSFAAEVRSEETTGLSASATKVSTFAISRAKATITGSRLSEYRVYLFGTKTAKGRLTNSDTVSWHFVPHDTYRGVRCCTLKYMSKTMTVTEARAALPEVLDSVMRGEEVTITRHGQPVAVIVRPDALRTRRAGAAMEVATAVHELLDRSRSMPLESQPVLSATRADALIDHVRSARSADRSTPN